MQLLDIYIRWENLDNARYYEVRIGHDLIGDIILFQVRGSKTTKAGGSLQNIVSSYDEALKQLIKLHKRRLQHGYGLIQKIGYDLSL